MFLSIQKISHQFLSAKDISLSVDVGDKIGLIGKNSVGKSTLLRIIAGSIQPSTGSVCRTAKIHFIDNSIRFNKTNNFVWEYISDYNDNWWDVLSWINVQFNNEIKFDSKVSSLSGGELTKVIVSLAFFSLSDLILLDEPTNNLDLYSIERLIDLINESKKSFIIVSHNVDFINKCINKIWCIKDNKIVVCSGNYNEYKLIEENRANANLRKYINGIKQQKRECKIFQEKVIKSQRQISNLKRKIQKRDMPRGYLNKLKNNATAGLSSVFYPIIKMQKNFKRV